MAHYHQSRDYLSKIEGGGSINGTSPREEVIIMRVKKVSFIGIAIVIAMLVALCAAPVHAEELPPHPHFFWGMLDLNEGSTPIYVQATGLGVDVPSDYNPITTEDASQYGGPAWNDLKLIVTGVITDGTEIAFHVSRDGVNWVPAETDPEQVLWHSGDITRVDLTATIEEPVTPTGGGGGGFGGGGDTTPPRISDIVHCYEGVTETTADICWETNEKSTSQVEYWASLSMLSPLDETLVIEHHVQLTSLTPGTTYHYQTMSMDRYDNLAISDVYTFTTLGEAPEAPPPEEVPPPEEAPPEEAPPPAPPPAAPPEVKPTTNWTVIGGIIAGVVIVGLLIFFLVRRRAY